MVSVGVEGLSSSETDIEVKSSRVSSVTVGLREESVVSEL